MSRDPHVANCTAFLYVLALRLISQERWRFCSAFEKQRTIEAVLAFPGRKVLVNHMACPNENASVILELLVSQIETLS